MVACFISACTASVGAQSAILVDLDKLEPLPTPANVEIEPLRVAIAAIISPEGTIDSYTPLIDYLRESLSRPIEVEQRRTYAEVNELLRTGEVDLAFVCTSSYLVGKREFDLQLLVAPQVNGETVYRSQLIVPASSLYFDMKDLEGKVFAFTDPLSFTGRIYPTYLLESMGETPEDFFARTFFTYSHDDAIRAVADGLADAAAVDSLVLDFAIARDPGLASKLRVIHTSPPFGIPPVVVGPGMRPQLRAQLEEHLLSMHETSEGVSALQALDYDLFTMVSPDIYDAAEEVELAIKLTMESPAP